jgi:hypothetical protein
MLVTGEFPEVGKLRIIRRSLLPLAYCYCGQWKRRCHGVLRILHAIEEFFMKSAPITPRLIHLEPTQPTLPHSHWQRVWGWGLSYTVMGISLGALAPMAQAQGLPNSGLTSLTTTPTSVQLAALQATGIKIVLPGYVPTGFQLDTVAVQANRSPKAGGYRTLIVYQKVEPVTTSSTALNAAATMPQCFAIEAITTTAQSLSPGTASFPVNSPVFGTSKLNYGFYRTVPTPVAPSVPAPNPIPQPVPAAAPAVATWLSDWLGVPAVVAGVATPANPVYRFVGAGTDARLANCDNVVTAEAVKIIESLQFYAVPLATTPITAAPLAAAAKASVRKS